MMKGQAIIISYLSVLTVAGLAITLFLWLDMRLRPKPRSCKCGKVGQIEKGMVAFSYVDGIPTYSHTAKVCHPYCTCKMEADETCPIHNPT